MRRWLAQAAIKCWQHRSWLFITDPGFHPKAERILDLHARTFDGIGPFMNLVAQVMNQEPAAATLPTARTAPAA